MLDTGPRVGHWVAGRALLDQLEGDVNSQVANGVEGKLPTAGVASNHRLAIVLEAFGEEALLT